MRRGVGNKRPGGLTGKALGPAKDQKHLAAPPNSPTQITPSMSPAASTVSTRPNSASSTTRPPYLEANTSRQIGPHHKTPAFIAKSGEDAKTCAKLNKLMVEIGAGEFGFINDSDHPNALYVVHEDVQTAHRISYCYGADIVVKIEDGKITVTDHKMTKPLVHVNTLDANENNLKDVSRKVIALSTKWKESGARVPRLRNTNPGSSQDSPLPLPEEIIGNHGSLMKNGKYRKSMTSAAKAGNVKIFNEIELLVLGGAGPAASADFFEDTVNQTNGNISMVHSSHNGCPGKYPYLAGKGSSFLDHYRSEMDFFAGELGAKKVVTPCNTNHILMLEDIVNGGPGWVKQDYVDRIIDYRDALLKELKDKGIKRILVLGTKATTTTHRLYHKILEDAGIEIVTVDETEQKKITKAIYTVKAGEVEKAKDLIEEVVEKATKEHGVFPSVVLACTELPLPWSKADVKSKDWVCVSDAAIKYFLKERGLEKSQKSIEESKKVSAPPKAHLHLPQGEKQAKRLAPENQQYSTL